MAMINYVTEIRFGAGSAAELAQVCQTLGFKKPLFITDKGVVAAGLIERYRAHVRTRSEGGPSMA